MNQFSPKKLRDFIQKVRFVRILSRSTLLLAVLLAAVGQPLRQAEAAPLQAAVASVSLPGGTAEILMGENFTFDAVFQNPSTEVGYGPFIDLIFPVTGKDGAGAEIDDGIDFLSATYLGVNLTRVVQTFPDDGIGCVPHPYARDASNLPVQVCGTPGDKLVTLQLPFGSLVPSQPDLVASITAKLSPLADVGAGNELLIRARGGYQFGNDELDNPASDPSILGSWDEWYIRPTLLRLTKSYIGPEDETATGPNYPRQYRITVDIADTQTLTDLDLTDVLPINMQYVRVVSTTIRGTPTATSAVSTPSTSSPGGTLTRRFASVTGTTAANDAEMVFEFYIPLRDLNNAYVLPPANGDDRPSEDDAKASGTWDPTDPRDDPVPPDPFPIVVTDARPVDHTLWDKSIAIQKTVATVPYGGQPQPGKVLEYTLNIQISDYFAFDNLIITDIISDGQLWDATFAPSLSVTGNNFNLSEADFNRANYSDPIAPSGDGTTQVTFNLSAELLSRGEPTGRLVGGCIPMSDTRQTGGTGGGDPNCAAYNTGNTVATVKFRTVIQNEFLADTSPNSQSVDQGDVLDNRVTISGRVLNVSNLSPYVPNAFEDDDSSAGVQIRRGALVKTIYAKNGVACDPQPCTNVQAAPGETITYRFTYALPTSDVEDMRFTDFLPLPIFRSAEVTTFDDVVSSAPPAAGHAKFGPTDTFRAKSSIVPTITTSVPQNSITFNYGDYDNSIPPTPETVDILFTVTTRNDPFADGLFLTNQVQAFEGSTNASSQTANSIVQIQIAEPNVMIRKGVVWSDNASAVFSPNPPYPPAVSFSGSGCSRFSGTINSLLLQNSSVFISDISGLDGGDRATYAIIIENQGSSFRGAYDVTVKDLLPPNTTYVPGSLCVTDGTGTALPYTALSGGLTGDGIQIDDPSLDQGGLSAYSETSGKNIAVITFDVTLNSSFPADSSATNTATLTRFASTEGGPNFIPGGKSDQADLSTIPPQVRKDLDSTSLENASNTREQAAIGELATYSVQITVPEGTTLNTRLRDILPAGMVFVRCLSISAPGGVSTNLPGGFASACPVVPQDPAVNPTVSADGQTVEFSLGDLTNTNNTPEPEVLTLTYQAVVRNISSNNEGTTLTNNATLFWDSGSASDAGDTLTIVEPLVIITKSASPTSGDGGDTITFTVELTAVSGANRTDAYNVVFADLIPAGMSYVNNSLAFVPGGGRIAPTTINGASGPSISAAWDKLAPGQTSRLTFDATLTYAVTPTQAITNTGLVTYTSLPGSQPGPLSIYGSHVCERTGDNTQLCGGSANDYYAADPETVSVFNAQINKTLKETSEAHTGGENVVIGEVATYEVKITVPEGSLPAAQLRDILPSGMAFVKCVGLDVPAGVTTDLPGGFPAACPLIPENPAVNPTVSADARTITFNFGNISNSNNSAEAEVITLTYQAIVTNISTNDAGDTLTNTARFSWTGGSVSTSGPTLTILEPRIDVQKAVAVGGAGGAAGDPVTYTVTLRHPTPMIPGDIDAFDLELNDPLPVSPITGNSLIEFSGSPTITVVDSGGSVDSSYFEMVGSNATGWTLRTRAGSEIDFPYSPIRTITISVTGTLSYQAPLGSAVSNTATGRWTSINGSLPDLSVYTSDDTERNGSQSPAHNDYMDTGSVSFNVLNPGVSKVITDTNQSFTSGSNVAIGEIITYRVTYAVPQGTAYEFRSVDTLDNGLAFVDCVSVSNPDGRLTASNGFSCANATYNDATRTMTVDFGNLTNNDTDPLTTEQIVLDYTVVVLNNSVTNRGSAFNNAVTLSWREAPVTGTLRSVSGSAPDVTVVEPTITISKTRTPTTGDAGNTITFTIDLTASNTANTTDAYNVVFSDAIPTGMTYVNGSLAFVSGSGRIAPTTINGATGPNISASWDVLSPGQTSRLTFQVTLDSNVFPTQSITNTGVVTYTSLPGTVAGPLTTHSTDGCERTGDNTQPCGGANNDLRATSATSVSVPNVAISKALYATSGAHTTGNNVTIGEIVTYDLIVTLPEGVTPNTTPSLRVTDRVPAGMQYVNGSGQVILGTFNGTVPAPTISLVTSTGNGDDVRFDFGQITTTDDNVTTNNSFTIRLQVLVLDVPGNVGVATGQTSLVNDAQARSGTATTITSNTITTPVIEPRLTMTKSVNPTAAAVNDVVTYTLVVQNNGLMTAYDVLITDPLSETVFQDITCGTIPAGFTCSTSSSGGITTIRLESDGSPSGGQIDVGAPNAKTFTFTAKVKAISNGQVVPNTATIENETTFPGVVSGERDEPNVTASANLTGIAPDVRILKTDGKTSVIPGETIVYTLTVDNIGTRVTDNVRVTETVPTHTTFLPAHPDNAGWSCAANTAGSTCTYDIPGTLALNTPVVLKFAVQVDAVVPAGTLQVVNTASAADNGSHGADINPANNSSTDTDTLTAAPNVSAVKSVSLYNDVNSDGNANPGDTLEYTIVLTNNGNQDASTVSFSDSLDTNHDLIVGSVTTTRGTVTSGNTAGDTAVGVNVGTLPGGGGSATIKFRVIVDSPLAAGVTEARNQGSASGGNIPNTPTNRVDTPLIAAPDLQISKVDDVAGVIPGDSANNQITYTITYANTGNQNATGVVITETVPANTTYIASGSSAWSCADGAPAGTTCTLTIGNLTAGAAPASAVFKVRVNNTVPAGVTQIKNTVTIADDGANGVDPTPENNTDDEDTPVSAEPDVYVTKADNPDPVTPGATLAYTLTVGNRGNQGATGVEVTETVPDNTTYVASGSSAWSCADGAPAGTTCTLTIASLPAGSGQSLVFRVAVNNPVPAGTTGLSNSVSVRDDGSNGTDPNTDNNRDSEPTDINAAPDLTLQKGDDDITATPDGTITYTINYSNVGDQDATGVTITETIPANTNTVGLTNSGWTCSGTSAGSTCTISIGDLAGNGGSGTVNFTVRVNTPLPAGVTQIENTASIDDDHQNGIDPTPSNNSDSEDTPVSAAPDIAAEKSVSPTGAVKPLDILTYTIVITNNGDQDAADVVFEDSPDPNTFLRVFSVSTTQGTVITGNNPGDSSVRVNLGTISGGGGSATITFQAIVKDPAAAGVDQVINQGKVSGSNFPDEDTNQVNNDLTAQPDLEITKSDGDVTTATGQVITYTLTYRNTGNQDATGVVITETIPENTHTDGLTNTGWTCGGTSAGSTCTYTIGNLASGGGGAVTFVVRVNDTLPAGIDKIENSASIADDGANGDDPTPDNNKDDEDTPVAALPDLYVTKGDDPDPVTPGSTITYDITVGNQGDQDAAGVVITETVPDNTTYVASGSSAWSCADGAAAGTTCTLTIASLPAGESRDLTFIVRVASPFPAGVTQVQNTISAADDGENGTDPNPDNNRDSELTDVTAAPDLRITKTDGVSQVAAGSRLTYTITLDNIGDKVATNVVVTDTYPEHTTYVSSSPEAASHDPATRTLTWDPIDSVSPSDAPRTITVVVDVNQPLDPAVSSLTNTVRVEDDGMNGSDPADNNTATDVDAVGGGGKILTGTDMSHTGGSDVAIGEIVTYQINLLVRPGSLEDLKLVDTLDRGLALVDCQVSGDANLTSSSGDFADFCSLPPDGVIFKVGPEPAGSSADVDQGRQMILDFGTLTNSGLTEGNLTITYRAVVLNSAGNRNGAVLNNNAVWSWKGGTVPLPPVSVTVVEPTLSIGKEASTTVATPGSVITFRLTISSAPGNNLEAYDLLMTDLLPDGMTYVENTLNYVSGQMPDYLEYRLPNELRAVWSSFDPQGAPTVLEFSVKINGNLGGRRDLRNTANLEWTSLPQNVSTSRTTFNRLGTERSYDPGSEVNIYGASATVSLSVPSRLPDTGFAPGKVTDLPEQPADKAYQQTGDLSLEIPALKVTVPIVGVPLVNGKWDLTWLNRQAGYLEGTAFPTWNGNTGLTAHIFTSDGASGPFRYLDKLRFGDQVLIHAYGKKYIYSVRQVQRVQPGDLSPLKHEEKPWLTLLTCEDYDADSGSFRSRLAVRAVLIRTEDE